jgi:hypothetical protein
MIPEGGPLTAPDAPLPPLPGVASRGVRLVAVVRGRNPMTDVGQRQAD